MREGVLTAPVLTDQVRTVLQPLPTVRSVDGSLAPAAKLYDRGALHPLIEVVPSYPIEATSAGILRANTRVGHTAGKRIVRSARR